MAFLGGQGFLIMSRTSQAHMHSNRMALQALPNRIPDPKSSHSVDLMQQLSG